MTNNIPPKNNEIEISVFGPGVGESILIHMGDQNWAIVDSCIDPSTKEPLSISYLRKLGINPKNAVKVIIATHWHNDHMKGLSEIVNQCNDSVFVCSEAMRSDEFYTFISAYKDQPALPETGVDEINKVFDHLMKRGQSPILAIENRPLYVYNGNSINFKVTALSPSDKSILISKHEIGQLIPEIGKLQKWISPQSPNHYSVVLWINFGNDNILLGADLQNINDEGRGWMAIVNSSMRPPGKAMLYKIPHHGSENADNVEVWKTLVEGNPIAVVTPYSRLPNPLPTRKDINRIISRTPEAYLTANPLKRSRIKRERTVERQIKELGCKIYKEISSIGQVRLRRKLDDNKFVWNVELFGDAFKLTNLQ